MVMENTKELIFACFVSKQFNSDSKVDLKVVKVEIEFIGYLAVKEKEVGGPPLMKFKDVEHQTDLVSYPIKFEIFTFTFFERENDHMQTLFIDKKLVKRWVDEF
jgi:hypothetical protein